MAEHNGAGSPWDELAARARPKEDAVLAFLGQQQKVAVALSGGTDSTYLLALAMEALGPERVVAITAPKPAPWRTGWARATWWCPSRSWPTKRPPKTHQTAATGASGRS
ncbi:MAG: hypothetical protein H5T59_10430 [Anaerolineae bacterium]|nr:hypothetical protein [Anaerolineae bacterium]